jgi:hypothetical protein
MWKEGGKEAKRRREESAAGATFQIKFRGTIFQDNKHLLWSVVSRSCVINHQANTKKRTPKSEHHH